MNTNYSLKKWLIFILSTFALQAVILSIYHWKSLIVNNELFSHPLIFIHCFKEEDIWFAPGLFFSALILNVVIFIFKEKRGLYKSEMLYGTIAGLFNGGSTFLLLLATNISTSTEKGMLFPVFAVCVILFCSLWGKKLYKEKINWIAISLCIVGVILGSL